MIEIQRAGEIVTIRSLETVRRLLARGEIDGSTPVRDQGASNFIPARDHPEVAGVASMVGKPFTELEPTRPTEPKVAQIFSPVSGQDPGVRSFDGSSIPTFKQRSSALPVQPSPISKVSSGDPARNQNRSEWSGRPLSSAEKPDAITWRSNKTVRQPPRLHKSPAPENIEPSSPGNADPKARHAGSSPIYGAPRAFGAALIQHLIAFGVGIALAGIGRLFTNSAAFVLVGLAVSALLGLKLGQKLHDDGARSSRAITFAIIALSLLALYIGGGYGFIVAVVSGAALHFGWRGKEQT